MIEITANKVKEHFNSYNAKYFQSALNCILEVSTRKVRNTFGQFGRRNIIRIFAYPLQNKTENDLKGTIIHEMVHAFLFLKYGWSRCGHNSNFHMMLGSILRTEFGIRYERNRFHQTSLSGSVQTPVPVSIPVSTSVSTPVSTPVSTFIPTAKEINVLTLGDMVNTILGVKKIVEILRTNNKVYYKVEGHNNYLSPSLVSVAK